MASARQQLLAGLQPQIVESENTIDIEPFIGYLSNAFGADATLSYDINDDSYSFKTKKISVIAKAVNEAILIEVYQMGQIKHRSAYNINSQSVETVIPILESYHGQ